MKHFFSGNHSCLKWKSDGISFGKTIKESKSKFTLVSKSISLDNDETFDSQSTNFLVYDLNVSYVESCSILCYFVSTK